MGDRIQLRRGTTEEWVFANPILQAGEPGYETSARRIKLGNGVDRWSELLYLEADVGSVSWSAVTDKPSVFPPSSHASSHASNGSDALAPSDIGAAPAASPTFTGVITVSAGTAAAPAVVSGTGTSGTGVFWPAADTFAISTAGTERLRVDSSGRVGIGNTSPSAFKGSLARLVVGSGGSRTGITVYSTVEGTLAFGDTATTGADGYRGYISYIHADDYMAMGTGGAERLRAYAEGIAVTGRITASAGSDAAPAISNNSPASATGVFWPDDNTLAVSTGGTERMRVDNSGRVGIGTTSPSALLDINSDKIRLRTAKTPASAIATGNAGDICWDANYVYVCVATNTWKRSALSTW